MCSGGGSKRATIKAPNKKKWKKMWKRQKKALKAAMNGIGDQSLQMQGQLESALDRKEALMQQLVDLQTDRANDPEQISSLVDERVRAMMAASQSLVPDQGAQGVSVGASRKSDVEGRLGGAKRKGKSGLRIRRNSSAPSNGRGVGLSIQSGG